MNFYREQKEITNSADCTVFTNSPSLATASTD